MIADTPPRQSSRATDFVWSHACGITGPAQGLADGGIFLASQAGGCDLGSGMDRLVSP